MNDILDIAYHTIADPDFRSQFVIDGNTNDIINTIIKADESRLR